MQGLPEHGSDDTVCILPNYHEMLVIFPLRKIYLTFSKHVVVVFVVVVVLMIPDVEGHSAIDLTRFSNTPLASLLFV